MKLPTIINKALGRPDIDPDLKRRMLKNKEALLDVLGKNLKGNRFCPLMQGQSCIGETCEFFMELKSVNNETKQETTFYRCAHVETPYLLIELNRNIVELKKAINDKTSN